MYNHAEETGLNMRNGAAVTHTVVMGNLMSTDQSTLYLDANSGFDASRPITVFMVVTTRLGNAVTFKEMIPSAILSNFTVPRKLFGDAPFALTAPTTNSDGAFTYSSSNPAVATVSGTTVTIVGAGTSTITATQAATANYGSNSISTTLVTTPIILELDSNVTIKYIGNAADVPANSALFVQEYIRGTVEWFAVVKDGMKSAITAYANGGSSTPFTPPGQSAVPFNNIVTTLTTVMTGLFQNASTFNQPIASWDTKNVTDMSYMFTRARLFDKPINYWNTSNVRNMYSMFYNANVFDQAIGSWDTTNVTDMDSMFARAYKFNQPIGTWNTSKVTTIDYLFENATIFNQPIGSWNTANVTSMLNVFSSSAFNQAVGSWNTAKVNNMNNMFNNATVFNQDISSWNVALVTPVPPPNFRLNSALTVANMPAAFYPDASLSGFSVASKTFGDAPFALTAPSTNSDGAFTYSSSNPAVATISGRTVTIVGAGTTTITATQAATFNYKTNFITAQFEVITPPLTLSGSTVVFTGDPAIVPTSSARFIQSDIRGTNEWFAVIKDGMKADITAYATDATVSSTPFTSPDESAVPFNNIVTTLMTNMDNIFQNASTFNQPIASWDTRNVTSMFSMFANAAAFDQNISTWNTANVTNMYAMFDRALVFNQAIGSWNTSNVKNMQYMFVYTETFNQPIESWNTSNVTDISAMFSSALAFNQSLNSWNTANVLDMYGVFRDNPVFNQSIGSWNTSNLTNMDNMFELSAFNQPINYNSVTNAWNTAKVIYMSNTFNYAAVFNQNIGAWTTANVTSMDGMFNNATVFNQDISSWNVALVTPVPPTSFRTNSELSDANMPAAFLP